MTLSGLRTDKGNTVVFSRTKETIIWKRCDSGSTRTPCTTKTAEQTSVPKFEIYGSVRTEIMIGVRLMYLAGNYQSYSCSIMRQRCSPRSQHRTCLTDPPIRSGPISILRDTGTPLFACVGMKVTFFSAVLMRRHENNMKTSRQFLRPSPAIEDTRLGRESDSGRIHRLRDQTGC